MADEPPAPEERVARRVLRGAVVFGVVMATLQMGVLLWLLYC